MFPPEASFDSKEQTAEFDLAQTRQTTSAEMPHSREAEEAVIGSVLINPATFFEIRVVIDHGGPLEFYIHRLRFIWEALVRLNDRRFPVDILTVSEELSDMGRLDEIGGQAYLTALLVQSPTSLNAWAYAKMMHACYLRRLLLIGANQIATLAYDTKLGIDDVVSQSIAATKPAIMANLPDTMVSIRDVVREADEDAERNRQAGTLPGIPTGFQDIDLKLGGGAQKGEALMIAGRPGSGKTAFMLQIIFYAAKLGKRCVVFSLEMSRKQLINRWISQETGIDFQLIRAGMVPDVKLEDYYRAQALFSELPIMVDDSPRLTPNMMRAKLEVCGSMGNVDLVALDYLALLSPEMRYSSPVERINDFSRECKSIAREFDVPLWELAQMNRAIENKDKTAEPGMADLNEGGEKDPDVLGFLHHERNDDDEIIRSYIKFAKARSGPTGKIFLRWRPTITKFESIVVPTIGMEA